jgi:U3 small nucleolar RNA-associated protein 13
MSSIPQDSFTSQPLAKSQAVLSAAWRPVREQKSFYGGGKIVNSPALGNALVAMHDEDLHIFRPPHMMDANDIPSSSSSGNKTDDLCNTLCTLATLSGEYDGILCFAVNPKNGEIVTSHRSTLVKYWDVADISKASTSADANTNNTTADAEASDINALATASQVKPAFQFRETKAWRPHQDVVSDLDFDDKGNYLASAGLDKAVRVWDSRGHFCTHNFGGFSGLVSLLKFVPGKMWIVAVGEDGEVRLLDMHSSSCIAVLKDHLSQVTCVDFFNSKFSGGYVNSEKGGDVSNSDNNNSSQLIDIRAEADTLVTGGRDSVINVWRLNRSYEHQKKQKKGEAKQQIKKNSGPAVQLVKTIPVYESVEGVACVPSKVATASSSHSSANAGSNVESYTPEVVTAGEKGLLKWWNPAPGRNVATQPSRHATKGSLRACFMVGENNQENQLVSCGEDNGVIYRDLQSVRTNAAEGSTNQEKTRTECLARYMGHNQEILAAQFLDVQGSKILCATGDEHAKIVDSRTFNVVTPLIGHEESVLCIGGSRSSGNTASIIGTGSKDNTIRLWHSESGKCLAVLQGHSHSVSCITFPKKDQKHFISGSIDKTIKIWEILEADLNKKGVVKATAVVRNDILWNDITLRNDTILVGQQVSIEATDWVEVRNNVESRTVIILFEVSALEI